MSTIKEVVDDGIKATVMALREHLMMYYKGTCIDRFVGNTNVIMRSESQRAPYQYMREINRGRDMHHLDIGVYRLLTLEKQPDTLTLHNTQLHNSPQFRAVREGILDFMGRYLRGIALVEVGTKRIGKRDDSAIVTVTEIRQPNSPQVLKRTELGGMVYEAMSDGGLRQHRLEPNESAAATVTLSSNMNWSFMPPINLDDRPF